MIESGNGFGTVQVSLLMTKDLDVDSAQGGSAWISHPPIANVCFTNLARCRKSRKSNVAAAHLVIGFQ